MPEKNRFPVVSGCASYLPQTATTKETAQFVELITPSARVLDRLRTISMSTSRPIRDCTLEYLRRLTPTECERLQGFPDGWTDIKPGGKDTPDSPRYKALGNSMAVPVMRWIGERIEAHK